MAILPISVTILAILCLIKLTLRPANFPNGPRGLPLLGYFPLLPKNEPAHKILQKLAKIYGPVTGFFVGPGRPFISVVGPKAVKEALHNDDLNGRPDGAVLRSRTFGQRLGLMFVDGEFWQDQRRFTVRHLRDLGFGKTSIEGQMMDEINDLIADIDGASKSDPDHIVDFKSIFIVSIINILWAIIGGKRYQRGDLEFKNLLSCVENFLQGGNSFGAMVPVPATLLRLFPSLLKRIGVNTQLFIPIQKFIEESIEEHISTRSKGDLARDFIDVYLDEMEEQANKNPLTSFSRKQLVAAIQDLFLAGSETSSSTIGFVILHIINHPEVQIKMQTELDDVCGDYLPTLANRTNLPYTEAVLMEVLRMSNIAPMTVPHHALRDTQLQGYTIPKGCLVTVNLDSVFKDPLVWKDPEVFKPERHLDSNNKIIKNDALTPFGMGKRICPGESLARNNVFLFTAALLKTFEFKPVPNKPLPTLEPVLGLTLSPKPFKAVVVPRKSVF